MSEDNFSVVVAVLFLFCIGGLVLIQTSQTFTTEFEIRPPMNATHYKAVGINTITPITSNKIRIRVGRTFSTIGTVGEHTWFPSIDIQFYRQIDDDQYILVQRKTISKELVIVIKRGD